MRIALFILSLLFVSPASAAIRISTMDGGGSVTTYIDYWTRIGQSGEKVIIDAPCMSACTFFLGLVPPENVCITPRASLGLHHHVQAGVRRLRSNGSIARSSPRRARPQAAW